MNDQSILWRVLHWPGHEACRLFLDGAGWHLTGTSVFLHENRGCRLDYHLVCDAAWRTRSGKVAGWLGDDALDVDIRVDDGQRWWLNGGERPDVAGCVDLDLNFSPSTNLLPIRRLNLAVGQEAEVRAAWLRFPDFELEPLSQTYRRLDVNRYRYISAGGKFLADLDVNAAGLVTNYPGFWQAEE